MCDVSRQIKDIISRNYRCFSWKYQCFMLLAISFPLNITGIILDFFNFCFRIFTRQFDCSQWKPHSFSCSINHIFFFYIVINKINSINV
nr:MAG TPA: hypothetical protein [Inoviridae sp.]